MGVLAFGSRNESSDFCMYAEGAVREEQDVSPLMFAVGVKVLIQQNVSLLGAKK